MKEQMQNHPAADLFPMLADDEIEALATDLTAREKRSEVNR
jgi:hypothetical protein